MNGGTQYMINKLGKPVDRTEWSMSPQTYNAYYNASNNEIVLPAGIFAVPGKRDEDLDDCVCVWLCRCPPPSAMKLPMALTTRDGSMIQKVILPTGGRPAILRSLHSGAGAIIRQFNAFIPVDSLHVNGSATQGENIADLGGLLLGLDAYKKTESFKKGEKIGGFTPLQRYFLGYAYGWMYQIKKELLANLVSR